MGAVASSMLGDDLLSSLRLFDKRAMDISRRLACKLIAITQSNAHGHRQAPLYHICLFWNTNYTT